MTRDTSPRGVDFTAKPSPSVPEELPAKPARSRLDHEGRYHAHGKISYGVVGAYVFLLIIVVLFLPRSSAVAYWWAPWFLAALILVMLARYLSTTYRIDDLELKATRLLGGRRIRLDEIRRIEFASLRDLSPGGTFVGAWGWRGRMWSPRVGVFDSVHTDAALGLLVTAGKVPLYFSPVDPAGFARELSRRVRSYSGRLAVDVGDPLGTSPGTPA